MSKNRISLTLAAALLLVGLGCGEGPKVVPPPTNVKPPPPLANKAAEPGKKPTPAKGAE